MDWIMAPIGGFNTMFGIEADTCPHTWIQCSCTGGMVQCTVPNALKVDKPPTLF